MRKNLLPWSAALAVVAALASSSCTYDPYYSSAGGYYSSGYGDGYGYGGSSFSTSLFVTTGDPRWGYDPYTYCYYDYRSRRYYDPYLYGYYPIGYRPAAVYGVPHPHGWRPGHGYCPPPRTVRNVTVVNYQDRESAYRNSDYSWSRQVRQQSPSRHGSYSGDRGSHSRPDSGPRQTNDRGWLNPGSRDRESGYRGSGSRDRQSTRPSADYNTVDRQPAPDSSANRDRTQRGNFRQPDRSPSREATWAQDGREMRQARPETSRFTRGSSQERPQARPQESRRPSESPRMQPPTREVAPASPAPPAQPPREDGERGDRGGRGLRSLGEG